MPLQNENHYTYGALMAWENDKRYELYDGKLVAMASPSDVHQEILAELTAQFQIFLRGKPCKVYPAPL